MVKIKTLQVTELEEKKTPSSHVSPAEAFEVYFDFWYNLGLSPFKLRICPETGTYKVVANWKQKVRECSRNFKVYWGIQFIFSIFNR